MSITVVKKAFETGLAGKAACTGATMDYREGGKVQRVTLTLGNGETVEFEATPHEDLALKAREAGANYQPKG